MKPGSGWPIGIVAILATTIGVNIAVMRIAGNDPGFAVEPDYYRKAVAYDSTLAQARANSALGWRATAAIASNSRGALELHVELVDHSGTTVDADTVRAVAMYVARAASPDSLTLTRGADGTYRGALTSQHAGQWEVRIDARRANDRFTSVLRVEAPATQAVHRSEP